MQSFNRRNFIKTSFAVSGGLLLLKNWVCKADKYVWPAKTFGGNEKLFLPENDFIEIRNQIENNLWAEKLYQKLQYMAGLSFDEYAAAIYTEGR